MTGEVIEFNAEYRRAKVAQLLDLLLKGENGAVLAVVSNVILILSHDPELIGLLGYDEFTLTPVMLRAPPKPYDEAAEMVDRFPREWGKADISYVQAYIQRVWIKHATKADTQDAMLAVAVRNRYHPVRDWLDGLKWDGTPRLDKWLACAFGAGLRPDNFDELSVVDQLSCIEKQRYVSRIGACFLIAAVRRIRQPGCKFDHMLILEGVQSLGKSTALKELVGAQWFSDNMPADISSKDAAQALTGIWLFEFAEIEQIIRQEVEVIKAFITRAEDRFRVPYGLVPEKFPRQCVLAGTTNDNGYLRDATGNRRFWPVSCLFADVEWIRLHREQLWAEAAQQERVGEPHWIDDAEIVTVAAAQQAERQYEDVWQDRILDFVSGLSSVTISEILTDMCVPLAQQTRREALRVSAVLRQNGWDTTVVRLGVKTTKRWVRIKN